jgi:hypothetical protein
MGVRALLRNEGAGAPPHALIWEDATASSRENLWWISRARDEDAGNARDFIVAEDQISNHIVGMMRSGRDGHYVVIAASPLSEAVHIDDVILTVKDQIAGWLAAPLDPAARGFVRRWRRTRDWVLVRRNFPLALAAFFVGAAVGFLIATVAVSWSLVGWSVLALGLVVGASGGFVLKFIADRKKSEALLGAWQRFIVITLAATCGVVATSVAAFAVFWN